MQRALRLSRIFRDNSIGIDIEWITSRYNLTSDEFGNLLKFTDTKGFSSKRFLSGAYCSALKSSYGQPPARIYFLRREFGSYWWGFTILFYCL